MKLSTYFAILAVLAMAYGLALFFWADQFLSMYGLTLNPSGIFCARGLGAGLIELGVIFWTVRGMPPTDRKWQGLLVASIIFAAANVYLDVKGIQDGLANSRGWSTVILNGAITLVSLVYLSRWKKA